MKTRYATWCGGAAAAAAIAVIVGSCGGTGGGGGHHGNPDEQFVLNSNNAGRLVLNVNPTEVDANKSDRLGLVALGRLQHSRPHHQVGARRRRCLDAAAALRHDAGPHRLRHGSVRRTMSTARKTASLRVHGFRARHIEAGRSGQRDRRVHRLQLERTQAGNRAPHRAVFAMKRSVCDALLFQRRRYKTPSYPCFM